MATDPDYRANQREAQKSWRERNPDYWRKRKSARHAPPSPRPVHPASTSVKMDALSPVFNGKTDEYIICPVGGKMDALRVKIIALSGG